MTRGPRIAVFVSGHGFGHLARTAAVVTALLARRSVRLTVVTSAPRSLWPEALERHTDQWIDTPCDAGVVQSDDLHVDVAATHEALAKWQRESVPVRARLAASISRCGKIDCVIGDVPPVAFEVAADLGVPSVAVANFSWDWIYGRMGLAAIADPARHAYERASLLLELTPAAPMPAFPRRVSIGVLGRRASSDPVGIRSALGLGPEDRCVLLALRPRLLEQISLPPCETGLCYLSPTPLTRARQDVVPLPVGMNFLDALAVVDAMIAKSGYGILGDCATNGVPLVWARREGFPEDRVLADWLSRQAWAYELPKGALSKGEWRSALEAVWSRPRPLPAIEDVAGTAALEIARVLT